jgi:nucleoside-diphosphate-sugar epimerase
MDILVTGANGKVGKELCSYIKKHTDWKVIEFHRTPTSDLRIDEHIEKVFNNNNIDVVVHLAVTRNPMEIPRIRDYGTLQTDTNILFSLLNHSNNIKRFLFASSCAIYGYEPDDIIWTDELAEDIVHMIKHESYSKGYSCVDISEFNYPNFSINPYLHEKEHTVVNGTSKYINEHILQIWSRETNIPAISMRFFPIREH